jgi:Domain of Unknown Function (DUF930)
MRAFGLAIGAAIVLAAQAAVAAEDVRFEKSLKMIDPSERLEQLCDYTAMTQIRKENAQHRPDRAVANAMGEPKVAGDTLKTSVGAFRSRKKWFALSFSCTATPDHMSVISFQYTIGPEIPETQWAGYGLYQ